MLYDAMKGSRTCDNTCRVDLKDGLSGESCHKDTQGNCISRIVVRGNENSIIRNHSVRVGVMSISAVPVWYTMDGVARGQHVRCGILSSGLLTIIILGKLANNYSIVIDGEEPHVNVASTVNTA
jgi:hypothetical protein